MIRFAAIIDTIFIHDNSFGLFKSQIRAILIFHQSILIDTSSDIIRIHGLLFTAKQWTLRDRRKIADSKYFGEANHTGTIRFLNPLISIND